MEGKLNLIENSCNWQGESLKGDGQLLQLISLLSLLSILVEISESVTVSLEICPFVGC